MNKKFSILTFKYALEGITAALKEEPSLKLHFLIGALIIALSLILRFSKLDWIIVIFLIGFVIVIELTNTAIEAVVDGFTDQLHPAAKMAKDISAGAVLVSAMTAATISLLVFLPYLT